MTNYVKFKTGDRVRIKSSPVSATGVGQWKQNDEAIVREYSGSQQSYREPHVVLRQEQRTAPLKRDAWIAESCLELISDPSPQEIAALFGIKDSDPYGDALRDAWMAFNALTTEPHFKDHVSMKFNAEFVKRLADLMSVPRE